MKKLARIASLLAFLSAACLVHTPARAQFDGFGGGDGDMMTTMAPMLETMKKKLGKKRFTQLMQTMGPMMEKMGDGGGFGGGFGGFGGGLEELATPETLSTVMSFASTGLRKVRRGHRHH